jgi:nucleoside-diphosphate-sugar epimerase
MKKKIKLLIIGKDSFIASNIFSILKNKIYIRKIKYSDFLIKNKIFFHRFNYILNCSLHKDYVLKKYKKKNDLDYAILNKINNLNVNYIFLSTRKVYKPKFNISEKENINPVDNYGKNKIITENYIKMVLPNNYLILRISNIIGLRLKNNKKSHALFLDNFLLNIKNNSLIQYNNLFKDFISIDQFADILLAILKKNLKGTYNVSLGRKVYIREILKWLTFYCKKKLKLINSSNINNYNTDSFTLNNQKIKNAIKISIKKNSLKAFCLALSKFYFNKVN